MRTPEMPAFPKRDAEYVEFIRYHIEMVDWVKQWQDRYLYEPLIGMVITFVAGFAIGAWLF